MLKIFKMGNGSSQSIILGPSRLQPSYPIHNGYQYPRGVPKYVHPHNRVLPKPVAGQRLRSTDNGSILQTAGTIRGQRRDGNGREENVDPEVMGILKRRSEMIEKENDCFHHSNLRNHRMFHSEPNIASRVSPDGYSVEEMTDNYGNRRSSGGGVASRANKVKYKKKQRAPEPPPIENNLPYQLDRRYQMDRRCQSRSMEEGRIQRSSPCKCNNKSRAPQPPSIVVYPPPPPPLPSTVTTRTKISSSPLTNAPNESPKRSPSTTRAVECHDNKPSYEKNMHPLERWRNVRSSGDIRIDEQESISGSRTTVFDSRKISDNQTKIPSYLPQKPDPFQKEIQAVTKKIAESRQDNSAHETNSPAVKSIPMKDLADSKQNKSNSPPKFYFADREVFKKENANCKTDAVQNGTKMTEKNSETIVKSSSTSESKKHYLSVDSIRDCTTVDEIVPSLQRFSPGRQRLKSSSRASTPTPRQKAEKSWEELSKNIYNSNNNKKDDDSDIDIRLRPVLPRKPLELPKFSPAEAWHALGSDGLSSNQSTSDDGPESVVAFKKNVFPSSDNESRNRRHTEVPFGFYENHGNEKSFKHRSMSDSHWTPRQDLLDDSDISDGSEEAVVPRIQPNSTEISTRFSLPTVMFSNVRPIGSDIKSSGSQPYFGENSKSKQLKKKAAKSSENDQNVTPNFKKFLPRKNRYLSEEDIAVSDSNWSFGQYGLQKRGKQYSSDLMLSDKKKHELMMKSNFSEFLGDILVSKANHMRSQMKSSDSGNSNFSFYSTEGQIMYLPEKGGFVKENDSPLQIKGRVYDIRKKFDPALGNSKTNWSKSGKKKPNPVDIDLGRKRDLELAKMLEDEVRKRRNKEKITIRQQLQKMKSLNTDEDDDFDDEAYFTEPKSREESQSPFFQPGPSNHFPGSEFGYRPFRFSRLGPVTTTDSSRLSHWQSSPALLEDSVMKNVIRPDTKGHFSSSSVVSSPDPDVWMQPTGIVDSWLQRQRNLDFGKKHLGSVPILEQSADENGRLGMDNANDGDVSSSPTPALQKKKERRKTNIYKQLMDIVRKEEKHLRNAQRGNSGEDSRESSLSHRESTSSESSSTSAYSYSDSSGSKNNSKNGVPANKEFHTSTYTNSAQNPSSSFQVAFVQPYVPNKSYRPVPFEVNGYRMPGLQEENKEVKAEAS